MMRVLLGVVFAGALGGALVGVAESLVVVLASGGVSEEYWLVLFGVVSYGVIGAGLGTSAALAWWVVRRGRADAGHLRAMAVIAGVVLPGFVVARYHVAKRIFAEQLVLVSAGGLLAHVLLLAGAVLVAVLSVLLLRVCQRLAGDLGPALAVLGLVAVAFLIGATTEREDAPVTRRPAPPAAAGKPNMVLIVADTLRADAVDWSGDGSSARGFATLASDGVVFERAYAQSSWTRPSVATILTALYPSGHGAVQKMDFLPDRVLTLAEALREHGYWTAAFTTNINVTPIFNFDQGFGEFTYLEPSFYFGATNSATGLAVYKGLRVARERLAGSRMYFQHYYQDAHVVNDRVRRWLAEGPPEPFFLFIHYMDPHDPYFEIPYNGHGVARVMNPTPDPSEADRLRDLYAQDVAYLDEALAGMLGDLREKGLYDRTILALTSDHGEEFYEHQGWWHGTSLYEEVLHVPLLLKRPGEPLAGQKRVDLARTIDIAPTLMSAAGLPIPEPFLGIDLFAGRVTEPLLAEQDFEGNRLTSLRVDDWKLAVANPGNPRGLPPTELFDLGADPGETRNLATSEPDRTAELAGILEDLRRRIALRSGGAPTARFDAADRGT
jgi:arylsulfatase A-like enzyme